MTGYVDPLLLEKARAMSGFDDLREIPGYSGYLITPDGNIYSLRPHKNSSQPPKTPLHMRRKWRRQSFSVNLMSDTDTQETVTIFRALALAFVSPEPSLNSFACARDGNPMHTYSDNVEWRTNEEHYSMLSLYGCMSRTS